MARRLQRSREMQPVDDRTVAAYTAARAFLMGEWFGASLAVASVTLLYLLTFARPDVPWTWSVGSSLAMLLVGAFAVVRNWTYYERLDFPWAKRWHVAALVFGGGGVFFWLLFAFLLVLAWRGVSILPE